MYLSQSVHFITEYSLVMYLESHVLHETKIVWRGWGAEKPGVIGSFIITAGCGALGPAKFWAGTGGESTPPLLAAAEFTDILLNWLTEFYKREKDLTNKNWLNSNVVQRFIKTV